MRSGIGQLRLILSVSIEVDHIWQLWQPPRVQEPSNVSLAALKCRNRSREPVLRFEAHPSAPELVVRSPLDCFHWPVATGHIHIRPSCSCSGCHRTRWPSVFCPRHRYSFPQLSDVGHYKCIRFI